MKNVWGFKVRGEGSDELAIDIYDVVGEGFWSYGVTAKDVRRTLQQNKQAKRIALRINSQGGDVVDGCAIYNLLNEHPAQVTVDVDGLAASIASVIAMAGDQIRMAENAFMMIHNPWGLGIGEADDLRNLADLLDKMRGNLADIYSARSGQKRDAVLAAMDAETWMTAAEAKTLGYATEVKPCKKKMSASATKASLQAFAALNPSSFVNVPEALLRQAERARRSVESAPRAEGMDGNVDCTSCERCTDCASCNKCVDCTDCKLCNKCTGCQGCKDCSECTKCQDCNDCVECTGCTDCTDCAECVECDGCTDCVGCTDCEDCVGCVGMTGQKGMRGMAMQDDKIVPNTNMRAGAQRCRELRAAGAPNQGKVDMKLLATLCAILCIAVDSSEEDVVKAAQKQATRVKALDQIETELDAKGDAAVGKVVALKTAGTELESTKAELKTLKDENAKSERTSLIAQAIRNGQLTPADKTKLEDEKTSMDFVRGFLASAPHNRRGAVTETATPPGPAAAGGNGPALPTSGPLTHDGKSYEQMTPKERADLRQEEGGEQLYQEMRADWERRGKPALAKPKAA